MPLQRRQPPMHLEITDRGKRNRRPRRHRAHRAPGVGRAQGCRAGWHSQTGPRSENAAEQELDILMLEMVYRVEGVRALGYRAGLLGHEPDGSIEKRLLAHLAAHGDLPKARQPSAHSDARASVIQA